MAQDKDVTAQVNFGENDGECLPLKRCVCGREFGYWDFIIGIERELADECECGRKLYFRNRITVYEVVE